MQINFASISNFRHQRNSLKNSKGKLFECYDYDLKLSPRMILLFHGNSNNNKNGVNNESMKNYWEISTEKYE